MDLQASVDATGLTALTQLHAALERAQQEALDQAGAAILARLRETFLAEEDPTGSPWTPSLAGTIRKRKGGSGTLFDTGTLFHSIQLIDGDPAERIIGTDVPYAIFLQEGTRFMPPRTILDFTDEHIAIATDIFNARIAEALGS